MQETPLDAPTAPGQAGPQAPATGPAHSPDLQAQAPGPDAPGAPPGGQAPPRAKRGRKRQDGRWTALEREDRKADTMALRRGGMQFKEIARRLTEKYGKAVSTMQCWRDYDAELKARIAERVRDTDKQIEVELDAIETSMRVAISVMFAERATTRDRLRAARQLQSGSESRRKLLGLDAPVRAELTGKDGGPLAVADLSALTLDQLRGRFTELVQQLQSGRPARQQTIDVTPSSVPSPSMASRIPELLGPSVDEMAERYAKRLAERENGHGGNGKAGNGHG